MPSVQVTDTSTARWSTETRTRYVFPLHDAHSHLALMAYAFVGRSCAEEGHPVRREARGTLHHVETVEHFAPPGGSGEGARRDAQAAPARVPRPLSCVSPLLPSRRAVTEALRATVVHWPVAFPPGLNKGFEPEDPNRPGWVILDTEVTLVGTWKAMIALLNTGKVCAIPTT